MKSTGPSPVITIAEQPGCLLVKFHGIRWLRLRAWCCWRPIIRRCITCRARTSTAVFARTDHTSYCPYKGDASYFSLQVPGHEGANAVWSYENPKVSVEQIRGYVAFYPDQVTFEVVELDE
jgi:hypothetical protein